MKTGLLGVFFCALSFNGNADVANVLETEKTHQAVRLINFPYQACINVINEHSENIITTYYGPVFSGAISQQIDLIKQCSGRTVTFQLLDAQIVNDTLRNY